MRIGSILLLAVMVVMLGSCGATYQIRPATGGKIAGETVAGISIVADANAWDGQPYDLPNYMTPIAVRIVNKSGQDLRVRYADFALLNERGFRYSAVNPYGIMGQPAVGQLSAEPVAQEPRLLLAAATVSGEGRVTIVPGRRFFVYPRTHYVFRYYDPWPYSISGPPYYGPYVTMWNDSYYPRNPTEDIQRLGLPEGVVRSGGEISGFVYFQNAGQRSSRLSLIWTAHTPDGQRVAALQVPFVVVSR